MNRRRLISWTAFLSLLALQMFLWPSFAVAGEPTWIQQHQADIEIVTRIMLIILIAIFVFSVGPQKIARKLYALINSGLSDTSGRITMALIFAAIAAAIGLALHYSDLFDKLKDVAYARGVITYCITIATIGLAFILAFQIMFVREDADQYKNAREILTVFMGVLGTIVGFYFGSTTTDQNKTLHLAQLTTSPTAADTERVMAFVEGGAPPYSYTLSFSDKNRTPIKGQSSSGLIDIEDVSTKPPVDITLDIIDAKNAAVTRTETAPPAGRPQTIPSPNPASTPGPH